MTAKTNLHQLEGCWQPDAEQEVVTRLIGAVATAGITADLPSVVNAYVALKTKPLLLLVGPPQSGKVAVVEALANVLMGASTWRHQVMAGHAWWAGHSGNVALFTEAQTRLNADKILALVEEASAPENAGCLFMACLSRISPAELMEFFTEVAFQLRPEQMMRLPTIHLAEPVPYPSNFRLIGTMDSEYFDWFDEELLSGTTVIRWRGAAAGWVGRPVCPDNVIAGEKEFLRSCLRSEQVALPKLHHVLKGLRQPLAPLLYVESLLETYGVRLPCSVRHEAAVYLAPVDTGVALR